MGKSYHERRVKGRDVKNGSWCLAYAIGCSTSKFSVQNEERFEGLACGTVRGDNSFCLSRLVSEPRSRVQ